MRARDIHRGGQVPDIRAAGFFVLRTPLLPVDEYERFAGDGVTLETACVEPLSGADRGRLRDRLRFWLEQPAVMEALFLASPSLVDRLEQWRRDPHSRSGAKVERILVRYFARMTQRSTPFGLFAGCSVGTLGKRTRLELPPRAHYRRHTRLDMDYVSALVAKLAADPQIRPRLRYRPNSSLYALAGQWRYAEVRRSGRSRTYHLVVVEDAPYLRSTLERAARGARPGTLANALVNADREIQPAEARAYVEELIDAQILVPELQPIVTGSDPVGAIERQLTELDGDGRVAEELRRLLTELAAFDEQGIGVGASRYRGVAAKLESLPAEVDLPRLFQVDLFKPAKSLELGVEVVGELRRAVGLLHRLFAPTSDNSLEEFKSAFARRYGSAEVPLTSVLDEELGIGFERANTPNAETAPLLAGLAFPSSASARGNAWSVRDAWLLQGVERVWQAGADELVIEPAELDWLEAAPRLPLPDAFAVMGRLARASAADGAREDFRVYVQSVFGPSGALLLGRFCPLDEELQQHVKAHLRVEEAMRPDAVFAELVHLPEGRLGNILYRPVLRQHELSFLGASGAPAEAQIAVSDLWVSLQNGRVVLWSRRLGREIIPRLTTAHNFRMRSLGLYRFLCALQTQDVVGTLGWNWGPLEAARYLPRVALGRAVLARARWRLGRTDLARLKEGDLQTCRETMRTICAERGIPRRVAVADADNELLIDFDNLASFETFIHLVKGRSHTQLIEPFPASHEQCVAGPEGHYANEIIVPFERVREPHVASAIRLPADPGQTSRVFAPGSDWAYLKLYTGTATADRLLREWVGPQIARYRDAGTRWRWFFVRYADPDFHLRLRVHGNPAWLHNSVIPSLNKMAARALAEGLVCGVQWGTYERELERYGGLLGIKLSEEFFGIDSEAVLRLLEYVSGDAGQVIRWGLALSGIDHLLNDLGFDLPRKLALIHEQRESFGREFGVEQNGMKPQLNQLYRGQRPYVMQLLERKGDLVAPLAAGFDVLRQRSAGLSDVTARLHAAAQGGQLTCSLENLAASYIHMHVNRLLRSAQRAHELVLYDFLERSYRSQLAQEPKQIGASVKVGR